MSRRPSISLRMDQVVARWRLIARAPTRYGTQLYWRCRCECGTEREVAAQRLMSGLSKSCGCYNRDRPRSGHGLSRKPEYRVWIAMRSRCANKRDRSHKNYGERGVTVCPAWRASFESFIDDMGWRPSDQHTLERRNNDGNYEPGNCCWALQAAQQMNKRVTRIVAYGGRSMCVRHWARHLGIPETTLGERLRKGWPLDRALVGREHA